MENSASLITTIKDYFSAMISSAPGIKALVLDCETSTMIALAITQSEILNNDIYLIKRIEGRHDGHMDHLKAIYFIRPTEENLFLLEKQLKSKAYGSFYICKFGNICNV